MLFDYIEDGFQILSAYETTHTAVEAKSELLEGVALQS